MGEKLPVTYLLCVAGRQVDVTVSASLILVAVEFYCDFINYPECSDGTYVGTYLDKLCHFLMSRKF